MSCRRLSNMVLEELYCPKARHTDAAKTAKIDHLRARSQGQFNPIQGQPWMCLCGCGEAHADTFRRCCLIQFVSPLLIAPYYSIRP